MVVTVVIAAAAMPAPVTAIGNPEHALYRAHCAAYFGAHGAADETAHRPGDPVALKGALLRAAHDALRVAELRIASKASAMAATARNSLADMPAGKAAALVLNFFM